MTAAIQPSGERQVTAIQLWVDDDIEFMSPKDFDPPTPQDIQREVQTAKMMDRWVEEYNDRMEAKRTAWLNQPYQDAEGWGIYA